MNNLAKYRGIHGLTQTELSKEIGLSKGGVSFAEKNRLNPKIASKCAKILGENVFSILGNDAFVLLPKTQEDKDILINIIKGL